MFLLSITVEYDHFARSNNLRCFHEINDWLSRQC